MGLPICYAISKFLSADLACDYLSQTFHSMNSALEASDQSSHFQLFSAQNIGTFVKFFIANQSEANIQSNSEELDDELLSPSILQVPFLKAFSFRHSQCNCPQILLTDDEEMIKFCLRDILSERYRVVEASNG